MAADICPRCHKDREYDHERDGSDMCWCGDLLTLHLKRGEVDDLEEVLKAHLKANEDRLKFVQYSDDDFCREFLMLIDSWRKGT